MTLSTLYIGNTGTIVYEGHAGFLVSTVAPLPFALIHLDQAYTSLTERGGGAV